jgi:predicted dehydrogenase
MTSRREFLGAAALSATRVLGANDRINVGIIGVGGMGFSHVRMLKPKDDVRITAVSDVYTERKKRAREYLGLAAKDVHHEYQELLARPDVDAVFVVTPDHWHYQMSMDALTAGKDVYVQKPMAYRIEEAKTMAQRVKQTKRILQVGSQYASEPRYFRAREVVQQGLIGKPLWAQGTYCRNSYHGEWNYAIDGAGTPKNIDWKRFLGSAPERPFNQDRFFRWRKYWDYSGGISTDLLYHRLTPFLLALGPQFPVRVSANGGIYVHKDREVPDTISTTIEYPDFQVIMSSSMAAGIPGMRISPIIYGHEGSLEVFEDGLVVYPEEIYAKQGRKPQRIPTEQKDLHQAHMQNFFECMRSRQTPNLDAEFGYRVMVAIGMGVDAYRESRQLAFDPATERVMKAAPERAAYQGNGKNVDENTPS